MKEHTNITKACCVMCPSPPFTHQSHLVNLVLQPLRERVRDKCCLLIPVV